MPQVGTSQVIRFAAYEVDLQAHELRKGGLRLKLTGQPFQGPAICWSNPPRCCIRFRLQPTPADYSMGGRRTGCRVYVVGADWMISSSFAPGRRRAMART